MPRHALIIAALITIASGCTPAQPSTVKSNPPSQLASTSAVAEPSQPTALTTANHSFGIPNDFSGKLTPEQEQAAPKELRNVFHVGSVQKVTLAEFLTQTNGKTVLAEEIHDGNKFIAIQDYRCVGFPGGVTGMMIVVERYEITPAKEKQAPADE